MCLFYQNYWAHKLTSEKHLLAYKDDLACSHSWKNLGHNLESSFFFSLLYIYAGNMSMKKNGNNWLKKKTNRRNSPKI